MKNKTRNQAEQEHTQTRKDAFDIFIATFYKETSISLRLTDIDDEALKAVDEWRLNYSSCKIAYMPGWDWRKQVKRFRRRPRRVEMAIWSENELCGLCLGRISDRHVMVSIHYLEGNPVETILSGEIALIATRVVEVIASALKATTVSIMNPVEALIAHYERVGYSKKVTKGRKVTRLYKEISKVMIYS